MRGENIIMLQGLILWCSMVIIIAGVAFVIVLSAKLAGFITQKKEIVHSLFTNKITKKT